MFEREFRFTRVFFKRSTRPWAVNSFADYEYPFANFIFTLLRNLLNKPFVAQTFSKYIYSETRAIPTPCRGKRLRLQWPSRSAEYHGKRQKSCGSAGAVGNKINITMMRIVCVFFFVEKNVIT